MQLFRYKGPEMTIRLSIAFDTSARSRLQEQMRNDLGQAEQHRDELDVKKPAVA
jgi:hypothetical protein